MTTYPILVADLSGDKAFTIICERCHSEAVIHADELLNEGLYECPADTERSRRASTEARCRGTAIMKYEPGQRCRNCGRLAFSMPVDGCCSRRCLLQVEYAKTLGGAA